MKTFTNIGIWEQADPGVKRKIHAAGEFLMMMEVQFEAGAEGKDHSHLHEQMSYVLQGALEFRIAGQTIVRKQGEMITIPGGTLHGVTALESSSLLDIFTPIREDLLKLETKE